MLKLIAYPMVAAISLFSIFNFNMSAPVAASTHPLPFISFTAPSANANLATAKEKYMGWHLDQYGLSAQAFEYGIKGYEYLKSKGNLIKNDILSIVDFSLSSKQKRLYVIDMNTGKLLFHSLVAHGHNSGGEFATRFSNSTNSHESSLGFYITMGTYFGSNGYSLKLMGCEKGINDNAMQRAIVVHGAPYVSNSAINQLGYIGRSYGCPSLPKELSKEIIDQIKNNSCLFIYHPNATYSRQSKIING